MSYDVLGIGNLFLDNSAFVGDDFLTDHGLTKSETNIVESPDDIDSTWGAISHQEFSQKGSLGGSCLNVMKALEGRTRAIHGMYGSDYEELNLVARLNSLGIKSLLMPGEAKTGRVNCFVNPEDHERTLLAEWGSSIELKGERLNSSYYKGPTHAHLEGYTVFFEGVMNRSVELAIKNHMTLSIDLASPQVVTSFKSLFEENLPKMNLIFGNAEEMLAYTGCDTVKEAVEHFDTHQTVVATQGAEPTYVKALGEDDGVAYPLEAVENVVDTTGGGDYFAGGYIDSVLEKKSPKKCVQNGHRMASRVIQVLGTDLKT